MAPNLVATALHVVSRNLNNVPFSCDDDGTPHDGSPGAQLGGTLDPSKVTVYAGPEPSEAPLARGIRIVSSDSTTICENDVAFVVLDRPLDLPTYFVHRSEPRAIGDEVVVVGYGAAESDGLGSRVRRSEQRVTVQAVGQWIRTFTVSPGPCEGDSGGPALSATDELVGIFSSVSLDCTGPNAAPKYTDLAYFAPLVEQAFDAASAGSPWRMAGEAGAQSASHGASGAGGEAEAGAASAAEPPPAAADPTGCHLSGLGGRSRAWLFGAGWVWLGVRRRRRRDLARLAHTKMHDLRNNP